MNTSSIDLACADYSFPLLPHEKAMDLVALLDFTAINIGLFAGRSHLQPDDVLADMPAAARALSQKLQDRGLAFADIFYQAASFEDRAANHPDADQRRQSRDLFVRMVEFALRCNARHLTGLPGVPWDGEPYDTSLQRCAQELAWRVAYAEQAGLIYAIEPHLGSIVPTPDAVQKLLDLTPGLTLTLDYGHFVYQDIDQISVDRLIPHASHFHARGAAPGRLQAKFQENTVDFARILSALGNAGYTGYIEIEYVWIDWQGCNEVDNISETIQLRDHLLSITL